MSGQTLQSNYRNWHNNYFLWLFGYCHLLRASRSYSDTPHSVGLLWTSDQPVAATYTCQYTTLTREKPMIPTGFEPTISASCSRLTPQTARPLGPAVLYFHKLNWSLAVEVGVGRTEDGEVVQLYEASLESKDTSCVDQWGNFLCLLFQHFRRT